MALSKEIKDEINEETYEVQGDIYKIYISKSKNSQYSKEEKESFIEIAQYALKAHNHNKPQPKREKENIKTSKI